MTKFDFFASEADNCPICGGLILPIDDVTPVPFNNRGGRLGYVHTDCLGVLGGSYTFGVDTWGHHAGHVMRGHSKANPKLMHLAFQLKLEGDFDDSVIAEMVKTGRAHQAPWLRIKGGLVSPTFHDLRSAGRKLPATIEDGEMTLIIKGKDFDRGVLARLAQSGLLRGIADYRVTAYGNDATLRIKGSFRDGYAGIRKMLLLGKALSEVIIREGDGLDTDTLASICAAEGGCHANYKVTKAGLGGVSYSL